ncbi:MAG: DNA topoisomerase IV subunit A [Victivallales bacterium]|nr:DNA topoisomerase IV subunit A [Victivallales bacterium]
MANSKKHNGDDEEYTDNPIDEENDDDQGSTNEAIAVPDDNGETLRNFFASCYVQYSSYVVRDRAIPDVDDGLKPVQRRILHCLHEVDDGRFNKVAGVVGDTMHYHPHGDASIAGALTVLANKKYFIDRQGNFGSIITGLAAAAPRYIECRLTELAKETLFNPEITEFVDTYDGRLKEPVRLPAKVPSLLMLGSDGIAVGMSTHIFSHNFGELLQAEIKILKGEPFQILPDFPQGALMDATDYADGAGSIRVRARIEADGNKKLIIREVPPTTTTDSLLASIEAAAKRGKVKLAAINDYTAEHVCIEIDLQRNIYAEETIKELYAYTDCEKTLNSDMLVIQDNKPVKMTVSEVLHRNVTKLQEYLKTELELAISQLQEKVLEKTLAQIFVEKRIYKRIETCATIEKIFAETRKGLEKYRDLIYRDIQDSDIERLLQIPIRRISAFDIAKNEQEIINLNKAIAENQDHLDHLVQFTIDYIQHIYDKYAGDFPRLTEITTFTTVNAKEVARRDVKVYFDRQNHFVGTSVKPSNKDAAPVVLTEYDKIFIVRADGTAKVMDIPEKEFVGQTRYLLAANKEQVYCMLYKSRAEGTLYAKRFKLGAYILDKEYELIPKGCIVQDLLVGDGFVIQVDISSKTRRTRAPIIVRFADLAMRSREAKGFKITSYPASSIKIIERPGEGSGDAPGDALAQPSADNAPEDAPEGAPGDALAPPSADNAPEDAPGGAPGDALAQPSADKAPEDAPAPSGATPPKPEKPPKMFQLSFFDDDSFK